MTASLNQTDRKRLAKLAVRIGRTPQAALTHVLRDGFDECEAKAAAVLASLAEVAAGKAKDPEWVEAKAAAVIARHAGKTKAA